jgi:antitoxin MazE
MFCSCYPLDLQTEAAMRIFKWGNGLAIRLPKMLVDDMGLRAGDELNIVNIVERTMFVQREDRRNAALARMASRNWAPPPDYKFDRDDANER